ncbi:hypothetical protein [Burkholderia ambifaria]|uniref:hypothetical protein n=1 Tax=Burkholderia ambifaria TaxID=152480 RepID=UPI00158EECAC|nr:hypothetical protein [Burkholderia ambifaria]
MRRLKLRSGIDSPKWESFIFFALSLDEKLYDFTDDSFKAPALNTYTRTIELQTIAHTNFVAGVSKDALKPFLEELEWSVARDPALTADQKALCKAQVESISLRIGESAQVSRAVAGLRLVLRNHFISIQSEITKIITLDHKRKNDLQELASSFVIQAEVEGFPRRHTYHIVQKILILPLKYDKCIDPETALTKFFDAFTLKSREFDCVFLADKSVSRYTDLLQRFDLKCQDNNPEWEGLNRQQRLFVGSKTENQAWLIAEKVHARTAAEAHQDVAARFDALASVVRFFEHKSTATISRLSLTKDLETKLTYMSHEAPDPMHCWVGNLNYSEANYIELSDAIHGGHLAPDSAVRLARALRFHKAALISNSAENQLIDLWAALEGLLPMPKKEGVRIEYFAESILPTLTLTYPEKLFSSAYQDTLKLAQDSRAVLAEMKCDGSEFARFVSLLLCDEFKPDRQALLELLKSHPLLRNKLWRLSEAFQSQTAVRETLKSHRRKVKWHLYRIYFTRNSLMHSATSLPYLATLVENLHLYVDTLIRVIAKVAHESPEVLTIEGGLQYLAAWEKVRLEGLMHEGADRSKSPTSLEVWPVVFGRDMLLAPARDRDLYVQI